MRFISIVALAAVLAGCSSGGGPFNQPPIDQESFFGLAAAWIAENIELPPGPVLVLDRTDGEIFAGPAGYGGGDITGVGPVEGTLTDGARSAIENGLGAARDVAFVTSVDEAIVGSFDVGGIHTCPTIRDDGSVLRLSSADLNDVHNQVFLVGVALQLGCTLDRRFLRIAWAAPSMFGGSWELLDASGGAVSP